ncbi:MAG: hypothetical protein JWQ35_2112 [Bacteriovoracaceae bacterium]|nr:hypothetical protein [Bacteriovoracaceae bacterium]
MNLAYLERVNRFSFILRMLWLLGLLGSSLTTSFGSPDQVSASTSSEVLKACLLQVYQVSGRTSLRPEVTIEAPDSAVVFIFYKGVELKKMEDFGGSADRFADLMSSPYVLSYNSSTGVGLIAAIDNTMLSGHDELKKLIPKNRTIIGGTRYNNDRGMIFRKNSGYFDHFDGLQAEEENFNIHLKSNLPFRTESSFPVLLAQIEDSTLTSEINRLHWIAIIVRRIAEEISIAKTGTPKHSSEYTESAAKHMKAYAASKVNISPLNYEAEIIKIYRQLALDIGDQKSFRDAWGSGFFSKSVIESAPSHMTSSGVWFDLTKLKAWVSLAAKYDVK